MSLVLKHSENQLTFPPLCLKWMFVLPVTVNALDSSCIFYHQFSCRIYISRTNYLSRLRLIMFQKNRSEFLSKIYPCLVVHPGVFVRYWFPRNRKVVIKLATMQIFETLIFNRKIGFNLRATKLLKAKRVTWPPSVLRRTIRLLWTVNVHRCFRAGNKLCQKLPQKMLI